MRIGIGVRRAAEPRMSFGAAGSGGSAPGRCDAGLPACAAIGVARGRPDSDPMTSARITPAASAGRQATAKRRTIGQRYGLKRPARAACAHSKRQRLPAGLDLVSQQRPHVVVAPDALVLAVLAEHAFVLEARSL